ncbi:LysR family transcriptional regulator, partial [Streptomyces microflavus]
MDLTLLRTFLAVHRAGSFTRASASLGLSQPAITAQMRTLEKQVGKQLFERLPRGVAPTGPADELARRLAPHLDAIEEIAAREVRGVDSLRRTVHLGG